jgi:putative oxidoreductase
MVCARDHRELRGESAGADLACLLGGGLSMPMNPSIAEGHVFGRPDRDVHHDDIDDIDDDLIRDTSLPTMALIGRLLIAAIFLVSGLAKLMDTPGTVAHMTAAGIPYPDTLALVAGGAEVLGAIAIATGFLTRVASVGLILFMIPTTLIFHGFWNDAGPERMTQMANFMKNLAIIGGLAVLMAQGAGRSSLDHRIRRARARRHARAR